jgi:hypothetical protein
MCGVKKYVQKLHAHPPSSIEVPFSKVDEGERDLVVPHSIFSVLDLFSSIDSIVQFTPFVSIVV